MIRGIRLFSSSNELFSLFNDMFARAKNLFSLFNDLFARAKNLFSLFNDLFARAKNLFSLFKVLFAQAKNLFSSSNKLFSKVGDWHKLYLKSAIYVLNLSNICFIFLKKYKPCNNPHCKKAIL